MDPKPFRALSAVALVLALGCDGEATEAPVPSLNVVEREELGANWQCVSPDDCRADYDAFVTLAQKRAEPVSEAELDAQVQAMAAGKIEVKQAPLSPDELADAIWEGTGVRFLGEGLDARRLEAVTIGRSEAADYDETELLLIDPWVGTFRAILLLPKGDGPFPAVLALHGHPESAEIFRDQHHGKEFPARGYAILMPSFRVMAIDATEHDVSWKLLENGFSLIGLRVYEALLGLKYLRHHPRVDGERLGLIGHSGGASTGNLLVRVEPRIRAYVSDNAVDWLSSGASEPYHCETVPGLFPYGDLINDFSSSPAPVKGVIYDFLGVFPGVFDWYDEKLAP